MLKNIKSSYFFKLMFTFIEEKPKLKLVKYNKSIQKYMDINIINYKIFSGRYIIYELNGIGKEYDGHNDKLIFEGKYLNGERNGKGKEYYYTDYYVNCQILFEGEYLNGKRHGKGKEYYSNGKIRFEGEYVNGKEWKGNKYDYFGKIKIELNNNINGHGKEYNDDGKLIFEGEYLNGKRNGKGKEYNSYYGGLLTFIG